MTIRVHTTLTPESAQDLAHERGYVFDYAPTLHWLDLNGIKFRLEDGAWTAEERFPFSLQLLEGVKVTRVTIHEEVSGIPRRALGMYELPNGAGCVEVLPGDSKKKGAILLRGGANTLESARDLTLKIKEGSIFPTQPYGEQIIKEGDIVADPPIEEPLSPEVRANLDRAFGGKKASSRM